MNENYFVKRSRNMKRSEKIAFFISFFVFLIVTLTSYYEDLRSLTVWSCNVWDTLLDTGNPLLFYQYTSQNIYNVPHELMGCDILICLPWALWNLPIWILQRFFGLIIVDHPLMLLYSKCFLILLLLCCAKTIYDIGTKLLLDEEHIFICVLLFLSGFYSLNSVACVGQNDILTILLMLWALYALISNHWKRFLLFSALSIAFEPYFIFAYVAIILLKEKRIHYIFFYLCSGISIYLLQKIPFWNAPMYQESMTNGPTKAILYKMIENMLPLTPYMVSTFVLSLLALYLWIYLDHGNEWEEKVLYYSMVAFACFFLFVSHEHYRPLYFYALIYIVMLIKPEYFRINLLLETLSTLFMLMFWFINSRNFLSPRWFLFPFTTTKEVSLAEYFHAEALSIPYNHVLMTVVLFCIVSLVIINHPTFNKKGKGLCMKAEPYLILFRSCIFALPFIMLMLYSYL